MSTLALLTTLKPGVSREAYEEWAKRRDYAFMNALDCVTDFSIRRIDGDVSGADGARWMYIEQFTILDSSAYLQALESEDGQKLRSELFEFVDREKTVRFTSVSI